MDKNCKHCWNGKVKDSRQLGRDMRAERLSRGVKLRQVAAAMGFSHAYIGELERGTREWSPRLERAYIDALR